MEPARPDEPTRTALLRRLHGDPDAEAWNEFCTRYSELVTNYCRRTGLGADDCQELFQEVFFALFQRLPRFRYDRSRGRFRAYLWRVVHNQAMAIRRRRGRRREVGGTAWVEGQASADHPDAIWEEEWRKHHLRRAVERLRRELPSRHYEVFRLSAYERLTAAEIAQRCGTSVQMVYKLRSQAMERLRTLVRRQIEEEG